MNRAGTRPSRTEMRGGHRAGSSQTVSSGEVSGALRGLQPRMQVPCPSWTWGQCGHPGCRNGQSAARTSMTATTMCIKGGDCHLLKRVYKPMNM